MPEEQVDEGGEATEIDEGAETGGTSAGASAITAGGLAAREQGHLEEAGDDADPAAATARRTWLILNPAAPEAAITAAQAAAAPGLPALGEAHPGNPRLRVRKRDIRSESEARNAWSATAEYAVFELNPLAEPDKITWDFGTSTESFAFDHSDPPVPVCNSAGEPFDELPQRLTGEIRVQVERNVSSYSPVAAADYVCSVNGDSFTLDGATIGPRVALLLGVSASEYQERLGTRYRTLRFAIGIAPETWDMTRADRGHHELAGGKLKEIRKGTPPVRVESPYPLDGAGGAKAAPTDEPARGEFLPYRQRPFSALGFR